MIEALTKADSALEISPDEIVLSATGHLLRPKGLSGKPSKWLDDSRERALDTLNLGLALAALPREAQSAEEYDLSAMKDSDKLALKSGWDEDVQETLDRLVEHLASEEPVEICRPLTQRSEKEDWRKAMLRSFAFSLNPTPKLSYVDLKNLTEGKIDTVDIEGISKDDLKVAVGLSKGVLSRSTKDRQGDRSAIVALQDDDLKVKSELLKGSLETASRIREFQRRYITNETTSSGQVQGGSEHKAYDFWKKDLISVLSNFTGLKDRTQPGRTLSYDPSETYVEGRDESLQTREFKWRDLPSSAQVPLPFNVETFRKGAEGSKNMKDLLTSFREQGRYPDVASLATKSYGSAHPGGKRDAYLLLCHDIFTEVSERLAEKRDE